MALIKQFFFLLVSLCLILQGAIATKYQEWDGLPDCVMYCIEYSATHTDGLNCNKKRPDCYCPNSSWHENAENCIYNATFGGCKYVLPATDKDAISSYIDNVFCPTLNGTKGEGAALSSSGSLSTSTSVESTSATGSPSTSSSSFEIIAIQHEQLCTTISTDVSCTTIAITSTVDSSTSTTTPSSAAASSTTAAASSTSTSTSTVSSSNTPTSILSSTSTESISLTTSLVIVTANMSTVAPPVTSPPTTTCSTCSDGGFVQDTNTIKPSSTANDGSIVGANNLFTETGFGLGMESMLALVVVVAAGVVFVN